MEQLNVPKINYTDANNYEEYHIPDKNIIGFVSNSRNNKWSTTRRRPSLFII
jgi:hypothetical protein